MKNIDIITDLKDIKETLEGGLVAGNIGLEDATNTFEATNVEDALLENKEDIINIENELKKSVNTPYTTTNGTKEFTCDSGYVDNIAIQGQTLVNLHNTTSSILTTTIGSDLVYSVGEGKTVTIVNISNKEITLHLSDTISSSGSLTTFMSIQGGQLRTGVVPAGKYLVCARGTQAIWETDTTTFSKSLVILEGDYTGKSIPYFEGLKSVGQGDRIDVLSCGGTTKIDLSNCTFKDGYYILLSNNGVETPAPTYTYTLNYIEVEPNTRYVFRGNLNVCEYDSSKTFIPKIIDYDFYRLDTSGDNIGTFVTKPTTRYIRLNVQLHKKNTLLLFKDGKYNTKQILATLRSLPNGVKDEIVKQGDKYYKIQRCGEHIIDGNILEIGTISTNTIIFSYSLPCSGDNDSSRVYCDKLPSTTITKIVGYDVEGISSNPQNKIYFRLSKAKCSDIATANTYLSNNPMTIVYELATPIVTEIPNPNPRTFSDKTTFLLNSGVVQGDASFEVTNSLGSSLDVMAQQINSAFQYGSNVKKNLVDKLTSQGSSASTDDTFDSLISKISLGKKWASGTVTTLNNDGAFAKLNVNFGFVPSLVIVCPQSNSNNTNFGMYVKYHDPWVYKVAQSSGGVYRRSSVTMPGGYVNETGFNIPTYNTTPGQTCVCDWYAFE